MPEIDINMIRALPIWFVATLFSVTLHEAAHAWVGKLGGDNTAQAQVTLNPMPHIIRSPFGMVVAPLITFFFYGGRWMLAWASAPYDPRWAKQYPKRAALMAAAGPVSDLLLAALALGIMYAGTAWFGWVPGTGQLDRMVLDASGEANPATMFVSVLFSVNILLGLFNLLPLPPLDGNAVVPLFLNRRLTEKWYGLFEDRNAQLFGMIIAWSVFSRLAPYIFDFIRLLAP